MMTPYQKVLLQAKIRGASEEELNELEEFWGKSCKTCDYWQEITEETGRCGYFRYLYEHYPESYNFEEPKDQPITSCHGLCEVFSGYREGDL